MYVDQRRDVNISEGREEHTHQFCCRQHQVSKEKRRIVSLDIIYSSKPILKSDSFNDHLIQSYHHHPGPPSFLDPPVNHSPIIVWIIEDCAESSGQVVDQSLSDKSIIPHHNNKKYTQVRTVSSVASSLDFCGLTQVSTRV